MVCGKHVDDCVYRKSISSAFSIQAFLPASSFLRLFSDLSEPLAVDSEAAADDDSCKHQSENNTVYIHTQVQKLSERRFKLSFIHLIKTNCNIKIISSD